MMPITLNQPDGLHLSTQATLAQLLDDEAVGAFADGLLQTALVQTFNVQPSTANLSLAEALHHSGPQTYPLLTALLMLDAEIHALVNEKQRVLSLPGFLSYRASLPLAKVPLETLRLPPLNPGGRYAFAVSDDGAFLAVRLDLNPTLNVAGHVRMAVSRVTHPPIRLVAAEQQLERRAIDEQLIEAAIAAASADLPIPLTQIERAELIKVLKGCITDPNLKN
jgi:hypothetical protein